MKTKPVKLIMVMAMLSAMLFTSCSSDDPAVVSKVELQAAIVAANTLLTTTFEGSAPGNFQRDSQHQLNHAVNTAQVIADLPEVKQETVNGAAANLNAAIAVYNGKAVVPIDPTNLVGQWTFDEIGTAALNAVVKDYSGNNRNGTMKAGHAFWGAGTNIPALTADRYGVAGKALRFDKGSNVEIPYNAALNPSIISISLWFKQDVNNPIVNNQYMVAMNRWNGYKFNMQDAPRAFFTSRFDNGGNTYQCCYDRDNDVTLAQGNWWHVVVTYGGGNIKFYVNGTLTKSWDNAGTSSSISSSPVNLVFGQDLPTGKYVTTPDSHPDYVNWGGYFIGALDEIRIYKSVLTASQVTSIYNSEKP